MDKTLKEIVRRLRAQRAYPVAEMAAILGVHASTVRWRCLMGTYAAERTGARRTAVLSQSVMDDLARLNPEMQELLSQPGGVR